MWFAALNARNTCYRFPLGRGVYCGIVALGVGLLATDSIRATAVDMTDVQRAAPSVRATVMESPRVTLRPLTVRDARADGSLRVEWSSSLTMLRTANDTTRVEFPISATDSLTLELRRFSVTNESTRSIIMTAAGPVEGAAPDVSLFRGAVADEPGSHAFLAIASNGSGNGYVTRASGERFYLSQPAAEASRGLAATMTVHKESITAAAPDFPETCGVKEPHLHPVRDGVSGGPAARSAPLLGAPHLAFVAVDADQEFIQLFGGDTVAAQNYITQVIGAVSDIYERDFDTRLLLSQVRLWPAGGEPFGADDLQGFGDWWWNTQDPTQFHLMHLFSGRRDLAYGGIAYLSVVCQDFGFGISGLLLGGFPSPLGQSHLGNWDVVVVAHEMGHNMGTGHTHDSYSPPIDTCGTNGAATRSDIMSYCHTTAGGLLNTDLRFHARVQQVVADELAFWGCLYLDCNGNDIDDAVDVAPGGSSDDVNFNGVPDECEDCNGNSILDSVDIAGASDDDNLNGVPDECEPDCDGNGIPDEMQIEELTSFDLNGNLVPDECETNCDGDLTADFREIALNMSLDLDRDTGLDACQDCDGNGTYDWFDMLRPGAIYIVTASAVREYQADSGVFVRTLGSGPLSDAKGVAIGPDGALYVASFGNDRVVRIDIATSSTSTFVSAGSGGLDGPTGVAFGPNGNLFVTSTNTSSVLEYNGQTGASVGPFVSAGGGGLNGPHGLAFGPDGHLYVGGQDNTVRRYNGASGAYIGEFASAGEGGLNAPRDMTFAPDGRLMVASLNTNSVLAYNPDGSFWGVFSNGPAPTSVWGVTMGARDDVFAARGTASDVRVIEYDPVRNVYMRSFIRGDAGLAGARGMVFAPTDTPLDCNANRVLDECDILESTSADCNGNSVPDECELASGGDCNGNLVLDSCECLTADTPLPENVVVAKNRYLSFAPSNGECRVAYQVTFADLPPPFEAREGETRWVAPAALFANDAPDAFMGSGLSASPFYSDWSGVSLLHVYGAEVVPDATYEIRAIHEGCDTGTPGDYSAPLAVPTRSNWGDVVGASGTPDFADISAVVSRFTSPASPAVLVRADLHPSVADHKVDFADISAAVSAFAGNPFPYPGPAMAP